MTDLMAERRRAIAKRQGPLFRELAAAIDAAIARDVLGDRLPPERELANGLGVSRTTVVAAYDELRARGRLERRRGSGTYIVARRHRHAGGAICPDPLACIQEFFARGTMNDGVRNAREQ